MCLQTYTYNQAAGGKKVRSVPFCMLRLHVKLFKKNFKIFKKIFKEILNILNIKKHLNDLLVPPFKMTYTRSIPTR